MEKTRSRKVQQTVDIDEDVPTAPTMEDFYYDPGISDQEQIYSSPPNDNELCDNLRDLSIAHSGEISSKC